MTEKIRQQQTVSQNCQDAFMQQIVNEGSNSLACKEKNEKSKQAQSTQDGTFLNKPYTYHSDKKKNSWSNIDEDSKPHQNSEKRKNPQFYKQQASNTVQEKRKQQLNTYKKAQNIQKQTINSGQLFSCKQTITEKEKQQMRKEMEDDMTDLKNSILSKKKHMQPQNAKKNKINELARLNRTVNEFPKTKFVNLAQNKTDQLKMILKMGQSKLIENYNSFQQWYKKCSQLSTLHLSMITTLQKQVDKRIKASFQNFEIYETFFKQSAKQQEKYCSFPVIDTKKALQNNLLSKSVFINCSIILNSFSDQNIQKCKRISEFVYMIKQSILKDVMGSHIQYSHKQLLRVREKISTLRQSLDKEKIELQQKYKELMLLFKKQSENFQLNCQEDFFKVQITLLRKTDQQMLIQKNLGEYCFQYYEIAIQEELKRSKALKEAIIMYNEGMSQAYNTQLESEELLQLKKSSQPKQINNYYAFEELFQEKYVKIFKENERIQDKQITVAEFSKFIMNFSYEFFDFRNLFLKQFKIQCSIKGLTNKFQPCLLVISVNSFISIFLDKNRTQTYSQPDITFKIAQKSIQLKPLEGVHLQIWKKNERRGSMMSYLWQNKHEMIYHLKFPKTDTKQQLFDYVRKLMK